MNGSSPRALGQEPRDDVLGDVVRRLVQAPWLSKSAFPVGNLGNVGLLRAKTAGTDWWEMAEPIVHGVKMTAARFGHGSPQHKAAMEYALRASKALGGRPMAPPGSAPGLLSRLLNNPVLRGAALDSGIGAALGSRTPRGAASGAARTLAAAMLGRATGGAAIPFALNELGLANLSHGGMAAGANLGQMAGSAAMMARLYMEGAAARAARKQQLRSTALKAVAATGAAGLGAAGLGAYGLNRMLSGGGQDKQAGLIDSMKSIAKGGWRAAKMMAAPLGAAAVGGLTMVPAGMAAAIGAPLAAYHAPAGQRIKHMLAALKGAGKASLPGLAVTGLSGLSMAGPGAALGAAGPLHGGALGGLYGSLFGPAMGAAGTLGGAVAGSLGPVGGGLAGALGGGLMGAPIGAAISTPGIIRSQIDAVRAAKASRAAVDAAASQKELLDGISGTASTIGKGVLGLGAGYGAYRFLKDRQEADQRQQYQQPRYYYQG